MTDSKELWVFLCGRRGSSHDAMTWDTPPANPNSVGTRYVRGDIADEMLEALKTVKRALESDEWKEWEGMAMQTLIRAHGANMPEGAGYQGEQFMPAVYEAIAKAEAKS